MRTLYLVRHAKSNAQNLFHGDFERTLNDKGIVEATLMGKRLSTLDCTLDLLISSAALRALTTAKLLASEIDYPLESIQAQTQLYTANATELLAFINRLDDDHHQVMLVGHNPSISILAYDLTKEDRGDFTTSGIAKINFQCDSWQEVDHATGEWEWFDYPEKST